MTSARRSLLHFSAFCENTLAATAAALADGANAIEMDLGTEKPLLQQESFIPMAQAYFSLF